MTSPQIAPVSDELPPDSQIGPYRVVRVLGKGGMGVVYEAVHATIQRRVAIKVLRSELASDPERAARFVNEARAVNLVEHPGVVQVADIGQQSDGAPYIVMEFLRGETLSSRLKRHGGPLPWPDVVRYAQQILDVLRAAHQQNIVHRDLKPDNVMLVEEGQLAGGMRVKVLDFGIAKLLDEANAAHFKTKTGALMGSPAYMSPEQCKGGERITVQSDLYALGVVLFELLSGQLPHAADGPGHMVVLHMFGAPRSLRELRAHLPAGLYALVDALLQKSPEARPKGEEVAQRLSEILRSGSGLGERVQTWALGLSIGLVLSAGAGTVLAKVRTGHWWWQPTQALQSPPPAHATTEPKPSPPPVVMQPAVSSPERAEPAPRPATRPRPATGQKAGSAAGDTTPFAPVDVSKDRLAPAMPIKPVR